jgi:hypothetical protein
MEVDESVEEDEELYRVSRMVYLPLAGEYKCIQLIKIKCRMILYLHSVVSLGGTMLGVYENGRQQRN